jgi:hypothetical protein
VDWKIFETAGKYAGLAGIALIVVLYIFRQILKLPIFKNIGSRGTLLTINNIINKVFWITILALVVWLAVALFGKSEPQGRTPPPPDQQTEAGLPTRTAAQLSRLAHDYSVAQDRLRMIDDIINNKDGKYSYVDSGRLAYYTKAKTEQQRFLDDATTAEEELKQGKRLDNLPSLPSMPLSFPEPSASATYTLWHDNRENNNFTVLYVTVRNGFAQGINLHRLDGTSVQLDVNGSAVPELVSPPEEWQDIDGIRILAIERMAWTFPGHLELAGAKVDVVSRQGVSFASATIGQPTRMSR